MPVKSVETPKPEERKPPAWRSKGRLFFRMSVNNDPLVLKQMPEAETNTTSDAHSQGGTPTVDAKILDGSVVVQMLPPKMANMFQELTVESKIRRMAAQHHHDGVHGSADGRSQFLVPSPVPTRRNRTYSQSERALKAPVLRGLIKSFCRQKGHGFISPEDGSETLFVHISDIDGEYVPLEGDEVTFRTICIPPRNEKKQACHVVITHLKPGVVHERWDSPVSPSGSGDS